ncbi:sulfite exporter TauE/SafE family protein [Congregibacter sp.]|uniref:sulfite exporter TauE/SafE family protein n=1 Tax=Congregibacter sp. TaxID=2744308 RepID=UPI003F6D35AE
MPPDLLALLPALLGAGMLAGLLAGLLGIGGGLIIVPVLFETFLLQGVPKASAMLLATGTSLAVIVPTAMSSSLSHWRRGNVDRAILFRWLPGMLAAVIFGAWLAPSLPAEPLIGLFAIFALGVGLSKLSGSDGESEGEGEEKRRFSSLPAAYIQVVIAAAIGFICVLLGVGAGTLGVAVMTLFHVPMHRAVGTAAVLGLVIAGPGALVALGHPIPVGAPVYSIGHVSLPGFLSIAPLAILMAPLGVRMGAALSSRRLQQIFSGFLLVVGLRMLSRLFL